MTTNYTQNATVTAHYCFSMEEFYQHDEMIWFESRNKS